MKFSNKDFFSKADFPADLVTFAEEILNGKLHFLWIVSCQICEISKNTFSYRTPPVAASAALVESAFAIRVLWKW